MGEWMVGWMDGWKDCCIDRWMSRKTDVGLIGGWAWIN